MTIYYFQGVPIVAPVRVETDELLFVNETLTMRQDRVKGTGQRWLVSFNLLPGAGLGPLDLLLRGGTDVFTTRFPQFEPGLTALTSNATAALGYGSNTMNVVETFYNSITIGRAFRFSNHSKVYLVTNKTSSGGNYTLHFYPNFQQGIPFNTPFNYGNNVDFRCRISADQARGITFTDGILNDFGTVQLVEAI